MKIAEPTTSGPRICDLIGVKPAKSPSTSFLIRRLSIWPEKEVSSDSSHLTDEFLSQSEDGGIVCVTRIENVCRKVTFQPDGIILEYTGELDKNTHQAHGQGKLELHHP